MCLHLSDGSHRQDAILACPIVPLNTRETNHTSKLCITDPHVMICCCRLFQGKSIPDFACMIWLVLPGGSRYNLHGPPHVSWLDLVRCRSCKICHNGRLGDLDYLPDLSVDDPSDLSVDCPTCRKVFILCSSSAERIYTTSYLCCTSYCSVRYTPTVLQNIGHGNVHRVKPKHFLKSQVWFCAGIEVLKYGRNLRKSRC